MNQYVAQQLKKSLMISLGFMTSSSTFRNKSTLQMLRVGTRKLSKSYHLIGRLASVLIFQCSNKGNSANINLKDCLTMRSYSSKLFKQKTWGFGIVVLKFKDKIEIESR